VGLVAGVHGGVRFQGLVEADHGLDAFPTRSENARGAAGEDGRAQCPGLGEAGRREEKAKQLFYPPPAKMVFSSLPWMLW